MQYSHILTGAKFLVAYLILKCVRRTNSKQNKFQIIKSSIREFFLYKFIKKKKNYLFKLIL